MTSKTTVRTEYDESAMLGVATLTESQQTSYARRSQSLNPTLTYVVPRQWVHTEKLPRPINGQDKSNRIFAVGVDENGVAITRTSLSVNGLRASHYGLIAKNPNLVLKAVKNQDGLWRASRGASQESVFESGSLPLIVTGNRAYISRPFAFKLVGRDMCYAVSFTEKSKGKWDIDTNETSGNERTVKFTPTTYNSYAEINAVPEIETDFIKSEYTDGLPE